MSAHPRSLPRDREDGKDEGMSVMKFSHNNKVASVSFVNLPQVYLHAFC
jgi:hypothetical protein